MSVIRIVIRPAIRQRDIDELIIRRIHPKGGDVAQMEGIGRSSAGPRVATG
jgi:hypothetical protein